MNELGSLLKSLNGKKIAYDVVYTKITGRLTAGVMLSQLMYWYSVMGGREFYKKNEELCEETGLSIDELKSAKKLLESKGFIKVELKSLPRKTYYTINEEVLINALTSGWETHQPVGGNSTDCRVEIPPTTSESNTENKTDIYIQPKNAKKKQEHLNNECEIFINHFNNVYKKSYRVPKGDGGWVSRFKKWRETYSLDEINEAVSNSKYDNFFKDILNPDMLLRVNDDKIGKFLQLEKPQEQLTQKELVAKKFEEMWNNAI